MIPLSLVLNVVVLLPVTAGLVRDAGWARRVYGPRAPARDILLALYLAILAASTALLAAGAIGVGGLAGPVVTLLVTQVVYKLLSPVLVGDLRNPVVVSNLAIAAVHAVTIMVTLPELGVI